MDAKIRLMQHRESGCLYKMNYKNDGSIYLGALYNHGVPNGQTINWKEEEILKLLRDIEIKDNKIFVTETGERIYESSENNVLKPGSYF